MKKLMACIAVLLFVTVIYTPSIAEKNPGSISDTKKESAEVKALINRVNEINAMDRSMMSRAEKKAIRKELRSIKKEIHRHSGGGIYVSAGVIILILVLIIIL